MAQHYRLSRTEEARDDGGGDSGVGVKREGDGLLGEIGSRDGARDQGSGILWPPESIAGEEVVGGHEVRDSDRSRGRGDQWLLPHAPEITCT